MKMSILTCAFVLTCLTTNIYGGHSLDVFDNIIGKCVEQIIENRFYLKPGYVFVAAKDIFIKIDGDIVPLETIYCDENGIYIHDYQLSSLIQCEVCKRNYNPDTQYAICPHLPRPKKK